MQLHVITVFYEFENCVFVKIKNMTSKQVYISGHFSFFNYSRSGVEKSIVCVARVVHLLLWTRNFFHLTCPWTSEKILYLCVYFQILIAIKIESLQTYCYLISEFRIVVKFLQNVKHESCS